MGGAMIASRVTAASYWQSPQPYRSEAGNQMARPSSYNEDVADEICGLLIEGKSLRKICDQQDMPDRRTVMRWLDAHPDFAAKCARARELQADLMDDLILDTAEATTSDNAAAARVKIAAYQWRAAKLQPKRYGDSTAHKHSGVIGTFDASKHTDDELAALAAVLGASAAGGRDAEGGEGGDSEAGG